MEQTSVTALFGLDWKLFIAQLFNFIVVLFVLWRWVFKPLGAKLMERTHTIEKSLKHAEEIEKKLKETEEHRKAEMAKVREQATEIIHKAQVAALQTKDQILAEAKGSADKVLSDARKMIENERVKMIAEIREEAATMIVTATEKVIREKLDPKKDEHLIKESLKGVR